MTIAKKRKKKQKQVDDDDTVMTKTTQEYSLASEASEAIECNLINDEDGTYDNNIVIIPNQVLFKMNDDTLNLKWKSKRKQKWQKERYSKKIRIKNKIASMITNATKAYSTREKDISRELLIRLIDQD